MRQPPAWAAIMARDGPECIWGDGYVTPEDASVEHLFPRSLFGGGRTRWSSDDIRYCALSHKSCNNDRGNDFSPPIASKVFSFLGWPHRPLWQAAPEILGMVSSIPPDIAQSPGS